MKRKELSEAGSARLRQMVRRPKLTKSHYTQWAAQFAVGAELSRRGYSAAFFLGNQPSYDLLCTGQIDFRLQVKGFTFNKPKGPKSKGGFVPIRDLKTGKGDDLIIIVHIPKPEAQFEFYIAKRENLRAAEEALRKTRNPEGKIIYAPFSEGIGYRAFEKFQDCWNVLPPPE